MCSSVDVCTVYQSVRVCTDLPKILISKRREGDYSIFWGRGLADLMSVQVGLLALAMPICCVGLCGVTCLGNPWRNSHGKQAASWCHSYWVQPWQAGSLMVPRILGAAMAGRHPHGATHTGCSHGVGAHCAASWYHAYWVQPWQAGSLMVPLILGAAIAGRQPHGATHTGCGHGGGAQPTW